MLLVICEISPYIGACCFHVTWIGSQVLLLVRDFRQLGLCCHIFEDDLALPPGLNFATVLEAPEHHEDYSNGWPLKLWRKEQVY